MGDATQRSVLARATLFCSDLGDLIVVDVHLGGLSLGLAPWLEAGGGANLVVRQDVENDGETAVEIIKRAGDSISPPTKYEMPLVMNYCKVEVLD